MFTSRQQLIDLLTTSGTLGGNTLADTQNTLQYLGTFSRDLEQPYFMPDPNLYNPAFYNSATGTWTVTSAARSKNIAFPIDTANGSDTYDPNGAKQDVINPSFLTVRNAGGQPVMKRRFPLSRLTLLETAANTVRSGGSIGSVSDSTSMASKIYDYFGLTWGSPPGGTVIPGGPVLTSNGWAYNHGDPTRIYSLSEIPSGNNPDGTSREPDFFETLKARGLEIDPSIFQPKDPETRFA